MRLMRSLRYSGLAFILSSVLICRELLNPFEMIKHESKVKPKAVVVAAAAAAAKPEEAKKEAKVEEAKAKPAETKKEAKPEEAKKAK